jgi:heme/copper-type cytochrome/quinol oxidase subunit 1
MSLLFLLLGGLMAALMRWQLGYPGTPIPGGAILGETRAPGGIMLPEFYNSAVTMHGTIMIFFAVMPLLVGVYANYLIPLQIGAPDMAFPRLNMASFWLAVPAGILMVDGTLYMFLRNADRRGRQAQLVWSDDRARTCTGRQPRLDEHPGPEHAVGI